MYIYMWYVMTPGVHTCRVEEAVKVSLSLYIYILIWPRSPAINLSAQVLLCRYIYTFKILIVLCTLYDLIYSTTPVATLIWYKRRQQLVYFTRSMLYELFLLSSFILVASKLFLSNSQLSLKYENIFIFHFIYVQNKIKEKSGKFPFGKKKKVLNFLYCVSFSVMKVL